MSLPTNTIISSLCLDALRKLPSESIDSLVTDPPYGLGSHEPTLEEILAYLNGASLKTGEFMNKDWEIPPIAVWQECYRVLKPGANLGAFAGTKTQDLISIGLRAVGFEKRDEIDVEFGPPVLRWLRAQGMPKSVNIFKEIAKRFPEADATPWEGYGTGLKPYWEPCLLFRKPIREATLAAQVLATGTGGLNIDASRVKHANEADLAAHKAGVDALRAKGGKLGKSWKNSSDLSGANEVSAEGRFPANVIFVHGDACEQVGTEWVCHPTCPAWHLNQQSGETTSRPDTRAGDALDTRDQGWRFKRQPSSLNDAGGASRFFMAFAPETLSQYVPKPSQAEKNAGLDGAENEHLTVKPVKLMRYLCRLLTPKGGLILDPYCGSGSTCVAAVEEGFSFIGIEKEEPSVATARARTTAALQEAQARQAEREILAFAHNAEEDDEPITPE